MNRKHCIRSANGGFSLIELMIAVAIIGIIAAIAYPSYEKSVMRSNRSDATATLMQDAQFLERCYTQNFSYNSTANCDSPSLLGSTAKGFYTIATPTLSATTYVLTATAVAGGRQANDTDCKTLQLDNTGKKTAFTAASATSTVIDAECWGG
ncbi:MAG: type IV pilin protein [Gammaproteobacteria bacterium]